MSAVTTMRFPDATAAARADAPRATDALPQGVPPLPQVLAEVPGLPAAEAVAEHLSAVEREMDGLRAEVELLRKRDGTLNFYMQRLDEELRLAAKLQQDFLPRRMPEVGPVRFHALWRPCGYVSGDFYDVMRLDEDHVGFYVADAVGHGVPAALLTMFIKTALVTKEITGWSYRLLEPGEAMGRLNAALVAQNLQAGTFCTAWYGLLNVRTLELRYASAGHPAPLLLRDAGEPAVLVHADGPLLGIFEDERFPTHACHLRPGDRLVVYTDGVDVAFGDETGPKPDLAAATWIREVNRRRHLGGAAFMEDITRRLEHETGSLDPRDDLTVVVAEVGTESKDDG
ncbi:MAG TPA: PP2C family protein-serine/threonine phosphatase [Humisphaera sp.]